MCFDEDYYKDLKSRKEVIDLQFDKENKSRFWLDMQYKNSSSKKKKEQIESTRGRVKVQIDVLTAEQADANPVGKARQEPNHSPILP